MKIIIMCQNRQSIINFDNVTEIFTYIEPNTFKEAEVCAKLNDGRLITIAKYGSLEKAEEVLGDIFDKIYYNDNINENVCYKMPM